MIFTPKNPIKNLQDALQAAAKAEAVEASRRETPGDVQAGTSAQELAVILMAAMSSGPMGSYRTLNALAPHGLPSMLHSAPLEVYAALSSLFGFPRTLQQQSTDGTVAAPTLTFDLQTVGESAFAAVAGYHVEVSYDGDTGADLLGMTVTFNTPFGQTQYTTELRSVTHATTELSVLCHSVNDGQFVFAPAYLGNPPVMLAGPTPGFQAAASTLTFAMTNALNKSVKVTLLTGREPKAAELVSQIVLAV